jgi:hypothetical protein
LKKRTSINSISDFHKEKEMVDFRKWLMAFAAAALLFGLGSSAHAQTSAFICNATAGNPHIVRQEGVAELVGDLILNCTGGSFTPAGTVIGPASTVNTGTNVQINLNTNVTSRLTSASPGSPNSEAILAIDEPFPSGNGGVFPSGATPVAGAATTQLGCIADGANPCLNIVSLGWGFGATGTYNGTPGHPNMFQGIVNFGNPYQINWQGVPIDAPGTTITRIIRITNVRANACNLSGNSTSLLPQTITELIGVSGSTTIIVNNPLQTVALAEKGLFGSVNSGFGPTGLQQCNSVNTYLIGVFPGFSSSGAVTTLSATEGFAAAFKDVIFFQDDVGNGQNVLGTSYNTESGYTPGCTSPGGYIFDYCVTGFDQSGREIGEADTGTEITFTLTGVGNGVSLFAPSYVPLLSPSFAPTGGGGFLVAPGSVEDFNPPATSAVLTPVTVTGGTATVTYQIFYPDPNVVESLNVSIVVAFQNTSSVLPATGTSSASINFAPLSTNPSAAAGPIPRFCQPYGPQPALIISACTCNLLFPFVTNQAGFDTGIAIANTTASPGFGPLPPLVGQNGTVTLNYYGGTPGGGLNGEPQYTTQDVVPSGAELVFTLSSGGGVPGGGSPAIAVPSTPGFEGYIIAQANFQYCHGFAFISDVGAQKLAEGYLAISLDIPIVSTLPGNAPLGLNRTGNGGENEGH